MALDIFVYMHTLFVFEIFKVFTVRKQYHDITLQCIL